MNKQKQRQRKQSERRVEKQKNIQRDEVRETVKKKSNKSKVQRNESGFFCSQIVSVFCVVDFEWLLGILSQ